MHSPGEGRRLKREGQELVPLGAEETTMQGTKLAALDTCAQEPFDSLKG